MIHLANHTRGRDKFGEVFKMYEDDGLLVSGRLDETAAHHAAREYQNRYRGTTITIDQLFEEAHRPDTKQELRASQPFPSLAVSASTTRLPARSVGTRSSAT